MDGLLGNAPFLDGAHGAAGFAWHAYGCAELHHCLIEISGSRSRQKCLRMLPDLCGGQTGDRSLSSACIDVEESLQHTLDVAIHNRDWLAKCNAGDGGSGVTSDARQSLKIFCPLRKPAGVLLHDLFSALVQTA